MARTHQLLERLGIRTGPLVRGRAEMVALNGANYAEYIARQIRAKAA
jgi:hypothetical protein